MTSYAGPPLPKAFVEDSSRVWPKLPAAIFFNLTGSADHDGEKASGKLRENVEKGLKMWTGQCTAVPATAGVATAAPEGSEVWTVVRGTYDQILKGDDPTARKRRGVCGFADKDEKVLHVYVGASQCRGVVEQVIGHEIGHSFRIGHASGQCSGSLMRTDLKTDALRAIRQAAASDCEALDREELRRDCAENPNGEGCSDGGPDDGGTNPGPGDDGGPLGGPNCDLNPNDSRCPANCAVNPNHPDCDSCILNPNQPRCEDVTTSGCVWWPVPGLGWFCIPMAPPPGGAPGDRLGTVTQTSVSSAIDYRIHLDSPGMATAALTGMSKDFNCRVAPARGSGGGSPPPAAISGTKGSENCSNRSGTVSDSWSGPVGSGSSKLTVYPAIGGSGDYTLSVTVKPLRDLPFTVSETGVSGDRIFHFARTAKGKVSVSLTGMDRDMDCRVNGGRCSNHGGTKDDSWSGSLDAGVHGVTVYPFGGGNGNYTLKVSAEGTSASPPPAPVLAGEVSGRKQSLSWTAPITTSPVTRYQLQLRESSSQDWYFTSSGSPSPSSDIGPSVRSWSVTTSVGMVLRYRLRATNAGGDGAWSNLVELTSASSPATRTLPFTVSEKNVSSEQTYAFTLSSETKVGVSLTGMSRDMDCRVGSNNCTNRGGTRDDSWSGTLAAGSHSVSVYPHGGGSGSYTLKVSAAGGTTTSPPPPPAPPPAAPQLTGTVAGRTQTLNWPEPSSAAAITRYQSQTRASAAHVWRFTTAGSPSPSSNIGASARSWSVTTPAGLVRQYRLRATNSHGDGAWSNVVALTTPSAPPPVSPLSVPAIPSFRLPSAGVVNTVFPAASGGRTPYRYSVSGLPPGITFFPSTRGASGTLPTVRRNTTYTITYTARDSAATSYSVAFTATVVPP